MAWVQVFWFAKRNEKKAGFDSVRRNSFFFFCTLGWFSDFSWVNSLVVNNMAIFLSGVCVMIFPLCQDYTTFVVMALLYGFFVATFVSLTSIVLVDLLGLDKLTSAFGLLVLFRGLASMIGTPVAGALYDNTNSYDIPFYLAGGLLIISSFISGIIHILQCRRKSSL